MKFYFTIIALVLSLSIRGAIHLNLNGGHRIVVEPSDSLDMTGTALSFSVSDGSLPPETATSIGSEILLNSELKGYIENPRYYFDNPDAQTDSDLDLLMMTQGWRRYESADITSGALPKFKFPIEQFQNISGHVEHSFNKHPKGMKVALFLPTTLEMAEIELGDSSRFNISLDFVDGTPFTLEAQTKSGGVRTTSIHIDDPRLPRVSALKDFEGHSDQDSSRVQTFADFTRKQPRAVSLLDTQTLDEVSVTARKNGKWTNRSKAEPFRGYQEGDEKISRFPTMESMLRSLTVPLRHSQSYGGALPEPRFGEYVMNTFIPTPVFIDGFRCEQSEVFTLNPQNINSIEYFKRGDSSVASYAMEVLHSGLLLITTKYGNEGGRTPQPSWTNITPLGYRPPVQFYVPKYPAPDDQSPAPPDYRATLYWNPALRLDPESPTQIDIYNPTSLKSLNLTVQGITPDGKIIDITKNVQLP